MIAGINSEDRLVQQTFADHLRDHLGWESVYAFNSETLGPDGTLGRASEREVVLFRDLRSAVERLNPDIPEVAREQALEKLTRVDFARSLVQHNREFYGFVRDGVPVEWRDETGETRHARALVIGFTNETTSDGSPSNRFLAVRELKMQGLRVPHYNRRADLVCYVNGLPLVFIELKAVYRNIRRGFDENLSDYMDEHSIVHAFHHNAFIIVSNGDKARYGSITSGWDHFVEWKREDESEPARLDAEGLLNGMLDKRRLLDLVENFILFDDSRSGGTRKIIAQNHQVLGVNRAVTSVQRQEQLKENLPPAERLVYRIPKEVPAAEAEVVEQPIIARADPDLGRLGVFWHTQGAGKSYSMVFFVRKVRRKVARDFSFVVMTDREDLDDQIYRTFAGSGVADKTTPRASSGQDLRDLLTQDHRLVFTLIHKFNQQVTDPYSERDDIIVISDEAHRTQSGKFARNMRLALPNAAFIGFTGTPLFKYDHLTRRIFGDYISRYDFRRSEEDGATVKLIYENRGELLGLAREDLNETIAEKIEEAELDPDQLALLEQLLGKDYEVVTADDRLDKLAGDFVEHCATRWEAGKSMFVCIDKITSARMYERILPRWEAKLDEVRDDMVKAELALASATDPDERERLTKELQRLTGQAGWMQTTIIEIIISEAQGEVAAFKKWDFDIIPHRASMKLGFETPDGKRIAVDDAFKDPEHPFRVAIICAMWLTGFDVECLSTMYIDKPMKAHNLMQAIARANRVYPGKDCGVIVDYNGMLKSLREALAQYASGEDQPNPNDEVVAPIEDLVALLVESLDEAEGHLKTLGFESSRLDGATGFDRIEALRDAVDALYQSEEAKRRFEIMARQMFSRFKALLMEPSALQYAERHDNIEAIYKKLQERRDTSDVTSLLKELHRIVNDAIRARGSGGDQAEGLKVDLSQIDFDELGKEFAKKVKRKHLALEELRGIVEAKLTRMLAQNPARMDYYAKYQEIVAAYNREKDRATVEATFKSLVRLAGALDEEEQRAVQEGLSEDELAVFDLLLKQDLSKSERERIKQVSQMLLTAIVGILPTMTDWTKTEATQAAVRVLILDTLWQTVPQPPYSGDELESLTGEIYGYVWERSVSGGLAA